MESESNYEVDNLSIVPRSLLHNVVIKVHVISYVALSPLCFLPSFADVGSRMQFRDSLYRASGRNYTAIVISAPREVHGDRDPRAETSNLALRAKRALRINP